jgi:hypothetical protein
MALVTTPKGDIAAERSLQRSAKAGKLVRIHPGIYTNHPDEVEAEVRRNLFEICALILPGHIISHRSAFELPRIVEETVFLTGKRRHTVRLPGLDLKIAEGPGPTADDIHIPTSRGDTFRSSEARAALENLQQSRKVDGLSRTLSPKELEDVLERILALHGEAMLNRVRDQAKRLASDFKWHKEFQALDDKIGALMGTREARVTSERAIARAAGKPYDGPRVDLFDRLLDYLNTHDLIVEPEPPDLNERLHAFAEAYFSNYIEGTEFEIEEAYNIVERGQPVQYREDDSHDILGTWRAIRDSRALKFPGSYPVFWEQLRNWNREVIFARAAKRPGELKDKNNVAGGTAFVDKDLTLGTLEKGFERIAAARSPGARAAMTMFVVAEVHPFGDGNGRTARLAMNLALTVAGRTRIIIPTVMRDDYIQSLKRLTNHGEPDTYVRVLNVAAEFSRKLFFQTFEHLRESLLVSNAMKEPDEAILRLAALPDMPKVQGPPLGSSVSNEGRTK